MDFETCVNELRDIIKYVREESKPFILQFDCYRFRGHSMSDAGNTYREKEEIEKYKKLDPLNSFKDKFLKNLTSEEEIEAIEEKIADKIDNAFKIAQDSEFPQEEELFTDIY